MAWPWWVLLTLTLLATVAPLATGCATRAHLPAAESVAPAWPPAPAASRIVWRGAFGSASDLGARGGGGGLFALLTGSKDASFEQPYAVAVFGEAENTGPGGKRPGPARLAVADTGARVVHWIDLANGRSRILSTHENDAAFESPVGVAFDAQGRLHVCDSVAAVLVRFTPEGEYDRVLSRGFARPSGVAIAPGRDRIYVSDAGEHVVKVLAPDGSPRGDLPGAFRFPTHLSVDAAGRLAVSDSLNFRAVVLDGQDRPLVEVGGPGDGAGDLQRPKGVALDREGHLYAVDAIFDNVQIFDLRGRLLLGFGGAGDGPGEFALPAGLAIDGRNLIYVAATWNRRVQVFEYLPEGGES